MSHLLMLGCGRGGGGGGGLLDGLSGVTGAWSMSRNLLSAFASARYTDTAGAISALNDQSGNTRNFSAAGAARPTLATTGPNVVACASFDGTDDAMSSAVTMDSFINNNAGYIVISCVPGDITTNDATFYNNDAAWWANTSWMGVHFKDNAGTRTVHAFNWDTNADIVPAAGVTFSESTPYVLEWKHESGNLLFRVNKGTWHTGASGNSTVTSSMFLGRSSGAFTDIDFVEMVTFDTVPGTGDQDALAQGLMDHIGAT